jgi:hypothetical protein
MRIGSLTFEVEGVYYNTLLENAEKKIADFIDVPLENLTKYVNYEIDIVDHSTKKDYYEGKVTVRIKNV